AGYKSPAEAADAEKAVKALCDYGRKELAKAKDEIEKKLYDPAAKAPRPPHDLPEAVFSVFALGVINQFDELLANPAALVKRQGNDLYTSVIMPREWLVAA